MRLQIYYYTRTGRSKLIAEKLANQYQVETFQIEDKNNWDGVLGFLRGGVAALKNESINITYQTVNSLEPIVLIFPIWAGTFPPAVHCFLQENPEHNNIILIPTSLTSKLKQRDNFKQVIDLVGKDIQDCAININE